MNSRTLAFALSLTAILAMSSCATTGLASGEDVTKGNVTEGKPVVMKWTSDAGDSTQGRMAATLSGDRHYSGRYVQVTRTTSADVLGPLWGPWDMYWTDWPVDWGEEGYDWDDLPTFVTLYSNHVVARLTDENGAGPAMRCRFTLDRPLDGLAGGGTGQCQVGKTEKIEGVTLMNDGRVALQ